jgi:hypothetical protein
MRILTGEYRIRQQYTDWTQQAFVCDKCSPSDKTTEITAVPISSGASAATTGYGCKHSVLPLFSSFWATRDSCEVFRNTRNMLYDTTLPTEECTCAFYEWIHYLRRDFINIFLLVRSRSSQYFYQQASFSHSVLLFSISFEFTSTMSLATQQCK